MKAVVKLFAVGVLAFGSGVQAWGDLTIELTPGSASAHSDEISRASGTLKVKGTVDVRDFPTLNSLPPSVSCLDMKELKVAARGSALPDEMGRRTYPADMIPPYAFFGCKTREVIFPDGCSLGEGVMANASTESVILPDESVEIPAYAFYRSGVRTLRSTSGVMRIGAYALYGSSLESLSFPSLRQGGDYALAAMPELTEVGLNPSASLGVGFLMGCGSLRKVDGAPVDMPDYFAADSRRLDVERLVVGSERIGDYAVTNARNSAIVLASGLQSIGEGAFAGMTGLTMIEANACGADLPLVDESAFAGVNPENVSLYVAPGTAFVWKSDPVWGRFAVVEGPSSVNVLDQESAGIGFAIEGMTLTVSSDLPVSSVEVYDMSGHLMLAKNTAECLVSIDLGIYADSRVVMVRAVNAAGDATLKLALR